MLTIRPWVCHLSIRVFFRGVLIVQTKEARVFSEQEIAMLVEAASEVVPEVSEARTHTRRFHSCYIRTSVGAGPQSLVELG